MTEWSGVFRVFIILLFCMLCISLLIDIVVKQCCDHVVGGGDGVEVTREVQVDLVHRQHLSIAAAGNLMYGIGFVNAGSLRLRSSAATTASTLSLVQPAKA